MTNHATASPYDVVLIDNLDVVRSGVLSLQLTHPQIVRSVRAYEHVDDVDLAGPPPRVVVLDYWLGSEDEPSLDHIGALKEWGASVLLYTTETTPARLRKALDRGIDGLTLKVEGMAALAEAIAVVGAGGTAFNGPLARAVQEDNAVSARLTPAEVKVLRGLSYGLAPPQIADTLVVAESTVVSHIEAIRRKYAEVTGGKVNRARMIREGLRDGYLERPDRPEKSAEDPGFAG